MPQLKEIINQKDWDEIVLNKENSSLLQSWSWGQLQASLGKKVFRYLLEEDGQFVCCFQILIELNRYGKMAYIPYGPLTNWQSLNKEIFSKIIELSKKQGVDYLALDPQLEEKRENYEIFKSQGFISDYRNIQARYRWTLNIQKTEEELLKGMRKVTRYSINQATKKNISVSVSNCKDKLDEFYTLFLKMSNRKKIPFPAKDYFEKIATSFGEDAKIFYSTLDSKILSMALIVFSLNKAYYLYAASDEVPNSLPAQHPVIWEAIKFARSRGYEVFDFWGLEKPYTPENLKGFDMFKTGFGGEYKDLILPQHYILNPLKYWLVQSISKARNLWQRVKHGG